MSQREFLDVDPRRLRLPPTRWGGPDLYKLARQIALYGASLDGMPVVEVCRAADGELVISDGVTRASRAAELAPGVLVRVEVIDRLPLPAGGYPSVGDFTP
jgi:hypothetical protein